MGALTHWVCFLVFLKRTADVLAPRLNVVFRRLVRLGSFLAWWRQANVTPIPKVPPSALTRLVDHRAMLPSVTEMHIAKCALRTAQRALN